MSVFKAAALKYAAAGFSVFPCQPRSKIPATPHGFKDATRDPALIAAWWDEDPAYNVAIATGEVSGLFVLDIDEKPGRSIEEAIRALPEIPEAPTVRTGGGGLQYFFRFPVGSGLSISGGRLGLGVDTRGNGGYVVAPPSLHPHGTTYFWQDVETDDGFPEFESRPDTPGWIVERLAKQASACKQIASERIQGGRHDALMTYAALMRNMGAAPAEIEAALFRFKDRLDLSDGRVITDDEIRRIAQWCGDKGMGDVNVESVLHGKQVAAVLLANAKGAAAELVAGAYEPGVENPGAFPAELLDVPGIVKEWCDYIDRRSFRRQPELALAAVLAACGALTGRILRNPTDVRTNVYALGLCETGGGKDMARKVVKQVMHQAGADQLLGPEDFASESGLVSSLVVAPVQLYLIDEVGKLLASISSPKAGTHLQGIVSALLRLYSSADTMFKGKGYADAAKTPIIDQPHVCLYGTAVPDQTWRALGATSVEDGLLGRVWVFQASNNKPPKKRPDMSPPPEQLMTTLKRWIAGLPHGLLNKHPDAKIVPMTDEAEVMMVEFDDECEALEARMGDAEIRKLWTRASQKANQLALIRAWSRAPFDTKIEAEDVQWACKLAHYLTQSMVWNANRHLAGSQFEGELKTVLRYVEDAGERGRSLTDITRRFQRLGQRTLREVLDLALAGGRLATTTVRTSTKPATVYVLPHHVTDQGENGVDEQL